MGTFASIKPIYHMVNLRSIDELISKYLLLRLVSHVSLKLYKTIGYSSIPYSLDGELTHDVHPLEQDDHSTRETFINIPIENNDKRNHNRVSRTTYV